MRIIFIGTAEFAVPSLRALVETGHELPLVITQPDRPGHRLRLTPSPLKVAAGELGLSVSQPERIQEALPELQRLSPELMVLVAYGQIIPRSVLTIPRRGVLNVHASLLPRHRGAAPVAYALLQGDRVTGVTIMQMDEQLDHGPVLAKRELEIGPYEDAASLSGRLAKLGADLLVETVAKLDEIKPAEQDHGAAIYAPRLSKAEGELDWALGAEEIDRRVRAFTPWPGVTLPWRGTRIKVLRGRPLAAGPVSASPGDLLATTTEGVEIATGEGVYRLEQVQVPGRKPVPARLLVA